jgi:hypothetical protein
MPAAPADIEAVPEAAPPPSGAEVKAKRGKATPGKATPGKAARVKAETETRRHLDGAEQGPR